MANNTNTAGILLLVPVLLVIVNWISMLVLGAAAGYEHWHTPGFWETFFGLWSIGIIGSAFNGTKFLSKN